MPEHGSGQAPALEPQKLRARTWFATLRDDICAAFEAIERDAQRAFTAMHGPLRAHAMEPHRP